MTFRRCFRTFLLITAILSGSHGARALQASDPLACRISIAATTAPLELVLRDLAKRSGVPLSYSSTLLPRATVQVPAQRHQPLRDVLRLVLRDQPVSYGIIDGQLVLWRKGERPPVAAPGAPAGAKAAVVEPSMERPAAAPAPQPVAAPLPAVPKPVVRAKANSKGSGARRNTPAGVAPRPRAVTAPAPVPPVATVAPVPEVPVAPAPDSAETLPAPPLSATQPAAEFGPALRNAAQKVGQAVDQAATRVGEVIMGAIHPPLSPAVTAARPDSTATGASTSRIITPPPAAAHPAWERRPFQFTFVPPLSTNGWQNAHTVNRVSVNMLAGYAAGVDGVELGSLVNVVRDSVRGFQAAGLINATGNQLEGIQMAGLINAVAGGGNGWQAAGLINIVAKPSNLVQSAGLLNLAPTELKGVQMAGLLNVAGKVHGLQLAGLLNIADSVDGISLAPINLVVHGYHRVEVTATETFPFNASLKLGGSASFYTYFTGGVQPFTATPRWGVGYGIGAELASRQRFSLTIDAQSMQVNEDDRSWRTWSRQLNQHNQLRLLVGWAPSASRHFRVVFGPTANVLVTERLDPLTGQVNSALGTGQLGENSGLSKAGRTRVRGWVGFTAGLRF